jgi:hypothetical protein
MKVFTLLALAFATAVTSTPCTTNCCFGLTASGGQNGTVGQLDDGQARIGGGLAPAKFCITDTSIEDSEGRGCIITRKTPSFPPSLIPVDFRSTEMSLP